MTEQDLKAALAAERRRAYLECAEVADEAREWAEGDCRAVRDRLRYLAANPDAPIFKESGK